jgi:hypothetical protein
MTPQLQQVLRVYIANRQTWWILGWMTLMSLPGFAMLSSRNGPQFAAAQLIAFPVGGGVFLLSSQAKWQFCNPRARLLPGFATPHLAVLLTISVALIGLMPLCVAFAGKNPLGAAAFAVALASLYIWSVHAGLWYASVLALGLFFSIYNEQVAAFWLDAASAARWRPLHAGILVTGWIAIAAWLWRLSQLGEESDDYNLPVHAQAGSATRIERTIAAKTAVRQLLKNGVNRRICDAWHDALAGATTTTTAARQRLLRYGFAALPAFVSSLFMAAIFAVVIWMMSQSARADEQHRFLGAVLPSMNMLLIMPAIMASAVLVGRRPRMPQELLLPLTRAQYFDGLLRVMARNAVISWAIILAALLAFVDALSNWTLPWPIASGLAALSLGVQVYAFGATTRASQIQQGGKRNVVMMVLLIPAFIAAGVGLGFLRGPLTTPEQDEQRLQEQITRYESSSLEPETIRLMVARERRQNAERRERAQPQPAVAWTGGGICAILGVFLTAHSRRLWLNLELG